MFQLNMVDNAMDQSAITKINSFVTIGRDKYFCPVTYQNVKTICFYWEFIAMIQ